MSSLLETIAAHAVETISGEVLLGILIARIQNAGSKKAWAAEQGLSAPYVSDVVLGRRALSAVAPRLGYAPLTIYVNAGELAAAQANTAEQAE